MPVLVALEEFFYLQGHMILDNIILAHKVVHSLKTTKTSRILIKLDMTKSFDKISWKYIIETLLSFGFHPSRFN
jgi:hypothetical protein